MYRISYFRFHIKKVLVYMISCIQSIFHLFQLRKNTCPFFLRCSREFHFLQMGQKLNHQHRNNTVSLVCIILLEKLRGELCLLLGKSLPICIRSYILIQTKVMYFLILIYTRFFTLYSGFSQTISSINSQPCFTKIACKSKGIG